MSMAEDMIDGIFCEGCGVYLGEGDGFPRRCRACGGNASKPHDEKVITEQISAVAERRMRGTRLELIRLGFEVTLGPSHNSYTIKWVGKKVADFWPYKGWYNLVGMQKKDKQERGFENLKKYLKGFTDAQEKQA